MQGLQLLGRKHIPNALKQAKVPQLLAAGWKQLLVVDVLGIEEKCLHRHYRDKMDVRIGEENAMVDSNMFCIATGDCPGAVTSATPCRKTRTSWRAADHSVEVAINQPITIHWAHAASNA